VKARRAGITGNSSLATLEKSHQLEDRIDRAMNLTQKNELNNSVTNFNGSTGAAITPSTGYTNGSLNYPIGIAVDGSGNLWVASVDGNSITEFIGVAAPVLTPVAVGVANNTLGTRP
jgi:hypothetical protein